MCEYSVRLEYDPKVAYLYLGSSRGQTMDYLQVLHSGIAHAIDRFRRNPFDFLYERDLQALLFSILLDGFEGESIVMKGGTRRRRRMVVQILFEPCQ